MKRKHFSIIWTILLVSIAVAMASCENPWNKSDQKQVQVEVERPTMLDANLYMCIYTKADSVQTEYYVYLYAKDKYDAARLADQSVLKDSIYETNVRCIEVTPKNKPFKYQKDPEPAENKVTSKYKTKKKGGGFNKEIYLLSELNT